MKFADGARVRIIDPADFPEQLFGTVIVNDDEASLGVNGVRVLLDPCEVVVEPFAIESV